MYLYKHITIAVQSGIAQSGISVAYRDSRCGDEPEVQSTGNYTRYSSGDSEECLRVIECL